jgi:hypothetical protein
MYENEEKWKKQQEQFEERYQRKKKNAYNKRYANKTCWACGEYGHLIYWCPDEYQRDTNY